MKRKSVIVGLLLLIPLTSCQILEKYGAYENPSSYKVIDPNGETYNDSLKNIDISWVKGDVTIAPTTEYSGVTIFEKTTEKFESEFLCHVYRDKNFLNVKYCGSNLSLPKNLDKDLIIYVPTTVTLDEISIDCVSASVSIGEINCKSIEINNVSGSVSINKVNTEEIEYEGVSGSFTSVINESTKEVSVDQVSGSTIISVPSSIAGFNVDFDTTSGSFSSDFETIKKENNYYYDNGNKDQIHIDFDSVSGSLSVTKHKVEN